jgi:hypothetical protein
MSVWQRISEQIVTIWSPFSSGLRSSWRIIGGTFFGSTPTYENTEVNYNHTRSLYLNNNDGASLGAFFARPIVDLQVDFIGLPVAATDDENTDDFLNTCLTDHWAESIRQMLRNAIRDSKTVVRMQQDNAGENPLVSQEEIKHCRLEIIDPERVLTITRNTLDDRIIEEAVIRHMIEMVEEEGDFPNGVLPKIKEHEILEVITPDMYRYYDVTDRVHKTSWDQPNAWGFVPLVEVLNEYDSTLKGGQSDLETVYPLIKAFHDAMSQSLQAHKYHSVPKVKLKLNEVQAFIRNNFPEALDENGQIRAQAEITWKGKEILFLQAEEDAAFLEARSVLGDSKELLDFIIDCISIASETPRWAFMILEAGSANQSNNAQTLPWAKKIIRKRKSYEAVIQDLLKMVQKINNFEISRPSLTWELIRVEDQAAFNQALQQLIMGLEVAAQRKIISDSTYRELLRHFIPNMKNPTQEAKDAEDNFEIAPPQPFGGDGSDGSNGKGQTKNVPITQGSQGRNE